MAARPWRFIMLYRRQGFALRFRSDLGENTSQHLDPRRKRVAVPVDCIAKQPFKGCRFIIG